MRFKLNPFTGQLEGVNPPEFSWEELLSGEELYIPLKRQMIVSGALLVNDGLLNIDGAVVVVN